MDKSTGKKRELVLVRRQSSQIVEREREAEIVYLKNAMEHSLIFTVHGSICSATGDVVLPSSLTISSFRSSVLVPAPPCSPPNLP